MNKIKKGLLVLILLVLFTQPGFTSSDYRLPDASYEFYVYDELGILSQPAKDYIIEINKKLYGAVGGQVVVAIIDSFQGYDQQIYSTQLFEKWQVGSQAKDNGILIVISPKESSMWIETGYGLEGVFPDSMQSRIIENYFKPHFQQGDYEAGILSGFNKIIGLIEKEYGLDIDGLETATEDEQAGPYSFGLIGLIILLIFIDIKFFGGGFISLIARSVFINNNHRGGPPFTGGGFTGSGSSGGGGRSGGGGAGGRW